MPKDTGTIEVDELLNLELMRNLQDGFAEITGMTVLLCRRDGKVLTQPSLGNKFVRTICKSSEGRRSLIRSALEAARCVQKNGETLTAITFAGMPLFASPLVVEGERLATIVVVSNPRYCFGGVPVAKVVEMTGLDRETVIDALSGTPPIAKRQLDAAIVLLHSLATTLADLSTKEYRLRNRVSEVSTLQSVTSMFAGRANLKEILNITARQVCEFAEAKACSIRIYNHKTRELRVSAAFGLSRDYVKKGPLKLKNSPIDQEALEGKGVYVEDMQSDPRVIYKEEAKREGLVSGLAIGMIYRGRPVGVIHLYTGVRRKFDESDIESLKAIGSQAASAIINARLFREALEGERMQRQLKLASEVQRRMVPQTPPKMPRLEIGTGYEPSYLVGGDFYDFLELPGKKLAVVIADVAGKGIPASLQMASLRATIRAYIGRFSSLTELVSITDRAFNRGSLVGEFATLLIGIIDPWEKTYSYVSAGHNPAMLVRNNQIKLLEGDGPAIAIFENPEFRERKIKIKPGDRIVFYTDGLIDAMNFDHQTFGMDRLQESTLKHSHLEPQLSADNILWDIKRFAGLYNQTDDMSLVIVAFNPVIS